MEKAQMLSQVDVTGAAMHDAHVFSLCLTAPFLACTLGLLAHNGGIRPRYSWETRTRISLG